MVFPAVQWAKDLLGRLGAPDNTPNEELLVAWQQGEGTKARFNPLATTVSSGQPGETKFNSVGVKNFPSYQAGLDATVKTLRNGNYPTILTGLLLGDVNEATAKPAEFNTWGTGGARVISLLRRVQSDWPAVGQQPLPSMPGDPGSADTSTLPGGMHVKKPGIGDVPDAAKAIVSSLAPDIGTDLKSVLIFVTLLAGGMGLVLIGAKRAADPIIPRPNPAMLAAVA